MNHSRLFVILGLTLIGIFSRFLPHPPNFTALNSIALFGSCLLGNLSLSLFTVLSVMLITDFIIGFHSSIPFVYLSFALIMFLGHRYSMYKTMRHLPLYSILSSLIFFVISNIGAWLTDPTYSKTLSGLGLCYLAAIPFLANQIFGDLFYGIIIFGCFAFIEQYVPYVRLTERR